MVMGAAPLAGEPGSHLAAFEAAGMTVVNILDAGGHFQLGLVQQAGQPPILAGGDLPIDQEAQAFFKGKRLQVRLGQLLLQRLGHAEEVKSA